MTTLAADLTRALPEPPTLRLGPVRLPWSTRAVLVTLGLLAVGVVAVFVTLGTGALPVSPAEVIDTVLRRTDEFDFVVLDIGLPRGLVALLVGAGLGVAGALTQTLTRNPLGSPDVIGFDSGASLGALIALLMLHLAPQQAAWFAIAGGGAAALVVFALSSGGRDTGLRIVLIGLALGAMLDAFAAYLITRARVPEAISATRWLVGSLADSDWGDVQLAAACLVMLLPVAVALGRPLRHVLLGSEVAMSLGVNLTRVSAATVATAVGLSAVAVLAAGPISFVALAAPQLALRAIGERRTPAICASAAMGAALLAVSDLIGSRAFGASDLPVGLVTGGVGGVYLAWLLTREWRRRA